jgi:hypothetical protein
MDPVYKFQLSAGNDTRQAFPVYKDDLAIDYALEQNQEFYRGKLSGKLTFQKDDYLFIRSKTFDTQFGVVISISYDSGQTWAVYWSGQFWKTDCQFNEDDQTAIVTPNVNDRYNAVLAGMDKEYNLIDLAPEIQPIKLDKRPMIQVYVPGQTVIGCFLSGMWWEQECESVLETDTVKIEGHTYPALEYKYHFSKNKTIRAVEVMQQGTPTIPEIYFGEPYSGAGVTEYTNGAYKFLHNYISLSYVTNEIFEIVRISDGTVMWYVSFVNQEQTYPIELELPPVANSGATGTIKLYIHDVSVFARYVTDVEQARGRNTYPIPNDDIVENNRNYSRVIGYYFPNTIWISDYLTTTPTKWGIYQPGLYYDAGIPAVVGAGEAFPIARAAWSHLSFWFVFFLSDSIDEPYWRKEYTLKDTFPIWSVISVLLAKIAPGITHGGTTDYSQFLYDRNPITRIDQRLFITPKSNVISSSYDQPAQKAPITLKRVTDMLRDCFRCYWFIDNQNRFRIEHISYFMNGGAYPGTPNFPVVGIDLTQQVVTRNGKPWAFARNQYEFDKPEMVARYQFGWMDDVTEFFEGYPIDIISKYVNPGNVEQIDVSQFTSDIDYILLNPGEISKDGFVLLGAKFEIPFVQGGVNVLANVGRPYSSMLNSSSTSLRSGLIDSNNEPIICVLENSNYGIGLAYFDANNRYVGWSGWQFSSYSFPATGQKYVIMLVKSGGAQISLADIPNISISVNGKNVNGFALPYANFNVNETEHILQNAWVSFMFLQQYYMYDMPAWKVEINGIEQWVRGIKKLKTQTIKFPVLTEPDNMFNLIKTELGNGTIQKMSVNLSSRNANATLKYDTE